MQRYDMSIVAALVLGLLIGSCTDASALVLCHKKRKVVARASCRPNEQVLSLVGLGSPGSKGTAGAQGPVGGPPLRAVDAVGNDVGPLVIFDSSSTSPIRDLVLFVALVTRPPLTDGALLGLDAAGRPTGGRLFYASSDCTGTPLLVRKGLIASVQVIGDTVFGPDGPSADPTAGSVEGNELSLGCVGITPRGGCCRTTSQTIPFDNAAPVATLAELGIVPPLHAVLAP
jgi:hypothetical protein